MRFFSTMGPKGEKGDAGAQGATGATGAAGAPGANGNNGTNGSAGLPGVDQFGTPNARTVVAGTAYQATTNTKPAIVSLSLTSLAALSLTAGATFEADIVIGPAATIATTGGTVVGKYKNSLTGTLVVGLAINTASTTPFCIALPIGWYFAVRNITGTPTIVSVFDQQVG